jgi:hypothetical protein
MDRWYATMWKAATRHPDLITGRRYDVNMISGPREPCPRAADQKVVWQVPCAPGTKHPKPAYGKVLLIVR